MSDSKQYASVGGVVQFDPREREANGKKVIDVTLRALGNGKQVRVSLWPQWAKAPSIKKGDFVVADGPAQQNTGTNKDGAEVVYNNLNAYVLHVNGVRVEPVEEEGGRTVNKSDDSPDPGSIF